MCVFVKGSTGFIGHILGIVIVISIGFSGALAQQGVSESKGYVRRLFAKSLDRPSAVAPIGDRAVLVGERSGRILLIDDHGRSDLGKINVPGMTIFYVPERPYTEGIKDLIAVPGRAGEFLWCMTTGSEQEVRWTVGRARIATNPGAATMANEIVWRSQPQPWTRGSLSPFSGCKMAVDGADVIVAMGANSRATGSGRTMRVSMSDAHAPQVISTGHRNPSGVVLMSGVLWEVEHGPKGGDELNIIVPGGDYGWPDVSKGEPDDQYHQSFLRSRPGSIDPVVTWTPAIAPSSMTQWRGKLYVGALKGTDVIEITVDGRRVVSQRRFLDIGERVRDVRAGLDDDGLWVLTDGPDAELFQVTPQHLKKSSR